jgi:hypothetical protein
LPNKVEAAVVAGTVVTGLFGGSAMILRIVDLRRFAAIASELRQYLANGIAWQSAGESASWEEDEYTAEDGDGTDEADHHTADVLPHSSLALQIDDSATNGLMIKLLVTGPPPDDVLRSA